MDFRILGPLEALDADGQPIALGGSKRRAVLALLLLHANETLGTDQLIDELWGERPPAAASKSVQVHISRLRKALAQEAGETVGLVTRERGYELQLDLEHLDAHRFERLLARGRGELAAQRPEVALPALEEARSLWRGRVLADLSYEPFAQREIARLEDVRVAALEQPQVGWRGVRAKLLAARGRAGEAEELAEEGVRLGARTDFLTVHAAALLDLGTVLRHGGRAGDADAAIEKALELFRRKGDVVSAERAELARAAPM
jgi:DNA-binding SARP family transcriptional activator